MMTVILQDSHFLKLFLSLGLPVSEHIYLEDAVRKPEDARYLYLREWMGEKANFGFFIFFQIQAFWVVLFASPFLILVENPNPINGLDQIGLIIWLIGFCGVHLADKQLKIFKSQANRSRSDVCKTGLWKYSRHPNYFLNGYSGPAIYSLVGRLH